MHAAKKGDNDWYLVMNSSKDALKNAKGFKYDRNAMTWIPRTRPGPQPAPGRTASAPAPGRAPDKYVAFS